MQSRFLLVSIRASYVLSLAYAEVAADGERLGLLLDLGLDFDLGQTLRLALDPRACDFLHALQYRFVVP